MRSVLSLAFALLLSAFPYAQEVWMEAEDALLVGNAAVDSARGVYSSSGYVTRISEPGDSLRFVVEATGAFVQVRLAVASPVRLNAYELWNDGVLVAERVVTASGVFAELVVDEQRLGPGPHTIAIRGTLDVDYLRLVPTTHPGPATPPPTLADPATPPARALSAFLLDTYGDPVLSGQQDIYQGRPRTAEIDYVTNVPGRVPAVGAFDLIEYSPSRRQHGSNPTGWVEHWIERAGRDGIVTLMWDWNAPAGLLTTGAHPWWRGFYPETTTFDVEAALADHPDEPYAAAPLGLRPAGPLVASMNPPSTGGLYVVRLTTGDRDRHARLVVAR
jgi:mannan endo-1,4-beta-mannosidase